METQVTNISFCETHQKWYTIRLWIEKSESFYHCPYCRIQNNKDLWNEFYKRNPEFK